MKANIIIAAIAAAAISLVPTGLAAQNSQAHPSAPTESPAPGGARPQAPHHHGKAEGPHKSSHRGPHAAPPRHGARLGHGHECHPVPPPPACRPGRPVPPPPCRHHRHHAPCCRPAPRPTPAPTPGTVSVTLPGLTINVGV